MARVPGGKWAENYPQGTSLTKANGGGEWNIFALGRVTRDGTGNVFA